MRRSAESPTVEHQVEAGRFVVRVPEGEAYLAYRMRDERTLDALSTFTPPEARGQGLAGLVTKAALDHACERGLRVIPSCWYVAGWIQRHPDYANLRA